jgi:hypothetical protein
LNADSYRFRMRFLPMLVNSLNGFSSSSFVA